MFDVDGSAVALAGRLLLDGAGLLFGLTFVGMDHGAVYSPLYTAIGMRLASLLLFGALAVATASLGGVRPMDLPMLAAVGIADGAANLIFSIASTCTFIEALAASATPFGSLCRRASHSATVHPAGR